MQITILFYHCFINKDLSSELITSLLSPSVLFISSVIPICDIISDSIVNSVFKILTKLLEGQRSPMAYQLLQHGNVFIVVLNPYAAESFVSICHLFEVRIANAISSFK